MAGATPADARQAVADLLTPALTDVDVWPTPRPALPQVRPSIVIAARQMTPAPAVCGRTTALDVWCIVANTDDEGPADAALDTLLGQVLDLFDAHSARLTWSVAIRQVWLDANPCYRIEVEYTL